MTISPQGAIDAGAQWRRGRTSTWRNSGDTETGLPVGQHTVEFSDVAGWTKPVNQTVTISEDEITSTTASYTSPFFPFYDDFSTDKGWSGYEEGGWERGAVYAGSSEAGHPDPEADYSATEDNYVLGYAIGGNYPNDLLVEKEMISPAIDCTGQDRVYLKFWRYLNVESNESDYARIYVSNDRTNWLLIWENPEGGIMDEQWTPMVFDISGVAAGEGSVYVKFTMGPTNSDGAYSGWNIDDFEVTSNPIYAAEGTMGTEFTITGSGFGMEKGKLLFGGTPLSIRSWNDRLIRCRLMKVLSPGVYKVFAPGVYDITVVPRGSSSIVHYSEAFVVKPPEIHSIDRGDGTAWDRVTIRGRFFGTIQGKIYLEYDEGGDPVRKNCKVLRWVMDPTTGDGEIIFMVPRMLPEVCQVVVDPYRALPETEEPEGFTVKPPEIISVTPNVGTARDEITIRGNFFGPRIKSGIVYGHVYLGYLVNEELRRKECTVVSWIVDPSVEEGEIVFRVPGGLSPGVYDLIVKNAVGSDAVIGGFSLMAPEIVSVTPGVGRAGDQITLHGNFFGVKKGTQGGVYLGYSVNEEPRRKACTVVSWTVDPATEEGDIVFVVPGGLTPWTYDVIVTNSVGSDTELQIFTIE